jgi:hypothetical protein
MRSAALAALGLAALLTWQPGVSAAQTDDSEPPAPTWTFSQEDGETLLIFGTPPEWEGSSNYLRCQDHSGAVEVEFWADHGLEGEPGKSEPTHLTVASGAVSKSYDAKGQGEEMNGGTEVTATLAATEPVLVEFARTGVLRLSAYGLSSTDMGPAPAANARALMDACRK